MGSRVSLVYPATLNYNRAVYLQFSFIGEQHFVHTGNIAKFFLQVWIAMELHTKVFAGYKTIRIAPLIPEQLTFASGEFNS